jgi:periplasmic protein TonB
MKSQKNIENFDDIIFEKRNKNYGAYYLRKMYEKNLTRALITALVFIIFSLSIPLMARYIHKTFRINEIIDYNLTSVNLTPPPQNKIILPPKPLPTLKELEKKVVFTPPKIVDDTAEATENPVMDVFNQGKNGDLNPNDSLIDINPKDQKNDPIDNITTDQVFFPGGIQENPSFPGGEEKLLEFFADNIIYPTIAVENKIQGKVYLDFVVEKDGSISNIELQHGIGGGCDEEAIRVAKMMPLWSPGRQNNQAVRVKINLPVKFIINMN